MLPTVLEMRQVVDVPIACQPKAFRQEDDTEERGYTASRFNKGVAPEGMAEFAKKARAEGINYIGGCCGTGPFHIRAMAEALG